MAILVLGMPAFMMFGVICGGGRRREAALREMRHGLVPSRRGRGLRTGWLRSGSGFTLWDL